jgi:hypothetical protein
MSRPTANLVYRLTKEDLAGKCGHLIIFKDQTDFVKFNFYKQVTNKVLSWRHFR